MKKQQFIVILFGVAVIVSMSIIVSSGPVSLIDEQDDVGKMITQNDTTYTVKNQVKPSVDLSKINFHAVNDDTVELTIVLHGSIQNDTKTQYIAWYNTSTCSYYVHYINGKNKGWAQTLNNQSIQINESVPPKIQGNILTITYDCLNVNTTEIDFWGYATTREKNTTWIDIVPNSRPYPSFIHAGSNSDDSSDLTSDLNDSSPDNEDKTIDETRDFSISLVILAFFIGLILRKKYSH